MRRFGITWRSMLEACVGAAVLAALGGLAVRVTHASDGWSYAVIIGVTVVAVLRLLLFNGSFITITIRIDPPPQQR